MILFQICVIAMSKVRTRNKVTSHLSNLIGSGRDLIPSEIPPHRYVLRYGILLREQADNDRRNYPVMDLVKDMIPAVLRQWLKANALFVFPVINHEQRLIAKLKAI